MKTLTRDNPLEYRGYLIFQGSNHLKYDFIHKEYDGADDAFDPRCGGANTIEDCIAYIDEIEDDLNINPMSDNELINDWYAAHGGKPALVADLSFYESSWDMLMPVVEKTHEIVEEMERKYPDEKHLDDPTGWRAWSYRRPRLTTDRDNLYKQVVEFIKWYNQQTLRR